jgi:hypothetical protein
MPRLGTSLEHGDQFLDKNGWQAYGKSREWMYTELCREAENGNPG